MDIASEVEKLMQGGYKAECRSDLPRNCVGMMPPGPLWRVAKKGN